MQHLDEGTIHAWLDDQLPREEALAVEAHVAECRPCADAVAEARGLIAASSRILMALDDVPRDVIPVPAVTRVDPPTGTAAPLGTAPAPSRSEPGARRAQRRWFRGPSLAAAAAVVVAVGTFALMRAGGRPPLSEVSAAFDTSIAGPSAYSPQPTAAVVPSPRVVAPPAAPAPLSAPLGATAEVGRQAQGAYPDADRIRENTPAPQRAAEQRQRLQASAKTSNEVTKDEFVDRREARPLAVAPRAIGEVDAFRKAATPAPAAILPGEKPTRDSSTATVLRGASALAVDQSKASGARADAAANAAVATGVVRGRVTDANNTGLAGAMVSVAGTATGVSTSSTGEFTLGGVEPGSRRLTVRRIGYEPVNRDVSVVAGQTTTADVVLAPTRLMLSETVVTGAPSSAPAAQRRREAPIETAPGAPITATQSNAVGCYEFGITPASAQSRTGFRQVPRRVALDADIVPSNADGVWYRARDLARTGALPNGLWRPAGPDAVDLEWTNGTKTDRVRLSGSPGTMMRGSIEEIDRATATGEAGTVVAVRRPCEG